jgi:hypothetical protein
VTVPPAPKNPERSFGLSVGFVLSAIAVLLWWRGRVARAEITGALGAILVLAGSIYPSLLKYPSAIWWRLARTLGHVNARVLLTVLFWVVLVPLSLLWRLTGKDPLARRRDAWRGWSPYPLRYRDRKHYERMY